MIVGADAQPSLGRVGMFHDVVQGFFHGEEKVVALCGGQGRVGQGGGNVEPAGNPRSEEVVLRVVAEEGHESLKRVVRGIYGPDHFVHLPREALREVEDLIEMLRGFRRIVHVGLCEVAEEREMREVGAKVVVQVAGDAAALVFDSAFTLEDFKPALHPLPRDAPHGDGEQQS